MSVIDQLEHSLTALAGPLSASLDELSAKTLDELGRRIDEGGSELNAFAQELKTWATAHPEPIFAILRKVQPILIVHDVALVTRFADVQEVLSRDDVFQVTYADKFKAVTAGHNFFLGMQNTPQYTHDVSSMRLAVRREDLTTRIIPFIEREAASIVAASGGTLDVVADLTRIVPARLTADYVGVRGPGDDVMASWGAVISQYLFLAHENDQALTQAALSASEKMRSSIDDAIADRKGSRGRSDDVLERCLQMQDAGLPGMDDLSIRNNLFGVIVGALPTTSAAAARAVDELLRRPDMLARAQLAAQADDTASVARYTFEALRLNPVGPGVFRLATSDYTLAKGTARSKTIPQGKTVVALLQSAMCDGTELDAPEEFRIDRPPYHYMHFGYGLHTCFGQYINAEQIPRLVKAVLKCRSLVRADGQAGELRLDGPFPVSMQVRFAR
jgi:cytochrome P450